MATRRRFSAEFKQEAARLVRVRGVSVAQAARELEIHQTVLRGWMRAVDTAADHPFPGVGQQKPEQAELTRLRREVARLKMERDISKKAKAVTATARKLAVLFYNALRFGMEYVDPGIDYYEAKYRDRVIDSLERRARQLGLEVIRPLEARTGGVS